VKALTSPDVAALHRIAVARKDTDKTDRILLAEAARTGQVDDTLGKRCGRKNGADVAKRVAKLRTLGYLPAATA